LFYSRHSEARVNDDLIWLAHWYAQQCDGEWEDDFGVQLKTIETPGWELEIDLDGTELEDRPFDAVADGDDGELDWLHCEVKDSTFVGSCSPTRLPELLAAFRAWASADDEEA
jgi:Immunity protein 53